MSNRDRANRGNRGNNIRCQTKRFTVIYFT